MTLPAFDEHRLLLALDELSPAKRAAFGASCCLRLLPNYAHFRVQTGWQRDEGPLIEALSVIWGYVGGAQSSDVRELTKRCEALAPRSEDFDTSLSTAAQDACFAVCAVLDFLGSGGSDTGRIVQAASYARDSVDLFVQEEQSMDPRDPGLEEKILAHPLMQAELAAQDRDLAELGRTADLRSFRERCERHAKGNLGLA